MLGLYLRLSQKLFQKNLNGIAKGFKNEEIQKIYKENGGRKILYRFNKDKICR